MKKTTVYLPESLKRAVTEMARQRGCSEAEVIRQALRDSLSRPKPRYGFIPGDSAWANNVDRYLDGFGEQ